MANNTADNSFAIPAMLGFIFERAALHCRPIT
jgi:hypothetical protein